MYFLGTDKIVRLCEKSTGVNVTHLEINHVTRWKSPGLESVDGQRVLSAEAPDLSAHYGWRFPTAIKYQRNSALSVRRELKINSCVLLREFH